MYKVPSFARSMVGTLASASMLLSLIAPLVVPQVAHAATTVGPNNGDSFSNDTTVGTVNWDDPENAGASGFLNAEANLNDNQVSRYLKATDFDFSVPNDSTIEGIKVEVRRSAEDNNRIKDNSVRIVKGGSIGSENKAGNSFWGESETYIPYGSNSDLWGESWTPADINASNFGVVFSAKKSSTQDNTIEARVDHIRITIYYSQLPTHICHWSNGYAKQSPSSEGQLNGHTNHDEDIIPPFESFAGQNWNSWEDAPAGFENTDPQEVWENDCEAPAPTTGGIIVEKVIEGGEASPDDFSFQIDGGDSIPFEEDGQNDLTLSPGTYTIDELEAVGWNTTYEGCTSVNVVAGATTTCTITNTWIPELPESVKVTIVKYLDGEPATAEDADGISFPMHAVFPGGEGDYSLSPVGFNNPNPYQATTADMPLYSEYSTYETVAEECTESYPWQLEGYSVGNTLEQAEGAAITDDVPNFVDLTGDKFVIVHNEGCEPTPPPSCELPAIVSDASTQVDGHDSVVITSIPEGVLPGVWSANIPGASWIWSEGIDEEGSHPVESKTFVKAFTIAGTPQDSSLDIASDNGYTVVLNGVTLASTVPGAQNFFTATTIPIPAGNLNSGSNTLEITVVNDTAPDGYTGPNPGGLLYKLSLNNDCPPPPADEVKVHIYKYIQDGETLTQVADDSGLPEFPMESSWDAVIGGTGSMGFGVDYVLGDYHGSADLKYQADTSPMESPVDMYKTHEVTGTGESDLVLPPGSQCVADKYRLVGYKKSLVSLADALNSATFTEPEPEFNNFSSDGYIVVINEDCNDVLAELTSTVTMCKLDDEANPLAGWSLFLKGESVQDLAIPVSDPAGIDSNALTNGVSYIVTAVGTWFNTGQTGNEVDAEYSTQDNWATQTDGFPGYSADILGLQIDEAFGSNWGAYNSAHTYVQPLLGTGATANFRIYDGHPVPDVVPGWYSDNNEETSTLAVNISEGYAGMTQENGCVTFTGVPYGSYTAGETMQEGWSYVSGAGEVSVDYPTEIFTIVNHDDSNEGGGEEELPSVDLSVDKTVDVESAGEGETVEYTITVTNPSGADAEGVAVADLLPAGLTFVSTSTLDTVGAYDSGTGVWTIGFLSAETVVTLHISATVNGEFTGVINNTATVSADNDDSNAGNNIDNASFDATESQEVQVTDNGGGGGGGGGSNNSQGLVLGASTGPNECGPLLTDYMRMGEDNDPVQVILLQNFLNAELVINLALTGIFDQATKDAVEMFQQKYASEILPPWGLSGPTGWVYILTLWKINDISCPTLGVPKPGVVPFGADGLGGMGDATEPPSGKQEEEVAAGVVLGENTEESAGASSPFAPSANAADGAAIGFAGFTIPNWLALILLALLITGGLAWWAYKNGKLHLGN